MKEIVQRLRRTVADLQEQAEREIEERRQLFRYRLEQRRVIFEQGVLAQHRLLRMKILKFLRTSKVAYAMTAPVIYSLIIPIALMDLFMTVYQQICFRIYGIPLVLRGDHVVMDRKYLAYLNWIEKLNCIYCEYGNGVISYAREIASRTEQFWCPIKHARKVNDPHARYYDFLEFGDTQDFRQKLQGQRDKCRACETPCANGGDAEETPERG